eukprot:s3773_g10.t1
MFIIDEVVPVPDLFVTRCCSQASGMPVEESPFQSLFPTWHVVQVSNTILRSMFLSDKLPLPFAMNRVKDTASGKSWSIFRWQTCLSAKATGFAWTLLVEQV